MPGWLGFTLGAAFIVGALVSESASLRRARQVRRVERANRVGGAPLDRMGTLTEQ
jgi:hypothetical protein